MDGREGICEKMVAAIEDGFASGVICGVPRGSGGFSSGPSIF